MAQFHGTNQVQINTIALDRIVANPLDGGQTWQLSSDNSAVLTGLVAPSNPKDVATKEYVDGLVDASLKAPEAYDPTITGNYPLTYGGNAIQAGDSFRITGNQAGIGDGARSVNTEDLLIALVDAASATDATNWMVAESNRLAGSETLMGLLEIATQVETDASVDDTRAITPLKLATYISNLNINKTAGAGLLETTGTFDIQNVDGTITVNANDIQVRLGTSQGGATLQATATGLEVLVGSTNGTTLEITATGLELVSNVIGNRTFSGGTFTVDSGANAVVINGVAQTATITLGNSGAGAMVLESGSTITLTAGADNAVLSAQPTGGTALAIATTQYVDNAISGATVVDEALMTVNTTGGAGVGVATLTVAPTTGMTKQHIYLNGQRILEGSDYTVTNAVTGEITAAGTTVFTGSSVLSSDYVDA